MSEELSVQDKIKILELAVKESGSFMSGYKDTYKEMVDLVTEENNQDGVKLNQSSFAAIACRSKSQLLKDIDNKRLTIKPNKKSKLKDKKTN